MRKPPWFTMSPQPEHEKAATSQSLNEADVNIAALKYELGVARGEIDRLHREMCEACRAREARR